MEEKDKIENITNKFYCTAKKHLIDTTAMITVNNPFFAFVENVGVGMSDKLSAASRIDASILAYLGVGYLFAKGRDIYLKTFNLDNSKNKKWHDIGFSATFGVAFSIGIYTKNGATLEETIAGSIVGGFLGALTGMPVGYGIDLFRDLTGIQSSERVPKKIRTFPSKLKLGLAAALTATSISSIALMYEATPENFSGIYGYITRYLNE